MKSLEYQGEKSVDTENNMQSRLTEYSSHWCCVDHILLKALFRSPFMVRGNTFKCGCVGPAARDCEMSANKENGLLIAMTSLPGVLNQFNSAEGVVCQINLEYIQLILQMKFE